MEEFKTEFLEALERELAIEPFWLNSTEYVFDIEDDDGGFWLNARNKRTHEVEGRTFLDKILINTFSSRDVSPLEIAFIVAVTLDLIEVSVLSGADVGITNNELKIPIQIPL